MGARHSTSTDNGACHRSSVPSTPDQPHPPPPGGAAARPKPSRPQHEFLVDNEYDIVRANWATLRSGDTQAMGTHIFLRIFELAPVTKEAFESFRDKTDEELLASVLFRSHSQRFMQAVEVTILNLDALDVIILPNLQQLGRKHTQFHGFRPEYLLVFERAMEEVWREELGTQFDDKALEAWKKIFHLITTTVQAGYSEAQTAAKVRSSPK